MLLQVKSPAFALVLSHKCVEGIIVLSCSLNIPYFWVVLGSVIAENSLTSPAQQHPALLRGRTRVGTALLSEQLLLQEEEGLESPLQHDQFP